MAVKRVRGNRWRDVGAEAKRCREPYIRCAECKQVNICITCFAEGAEGFPHKNNHSYIIIRNNFPLFADSTWKAYEEIRFLDALLECGFGNWGDIARQLKTRNKEECEKHFLSTYIDNPKLPSFSESLQPLIKLTPLPYWEYRPIDIEDPPRYTATSGQCYQALGGYNAARGDFDVEYDNYAEASLSQMELDIYKNEDEDCKLIQSLQVAIFSSYNQRLKDRKRRKQIIRDHGLILIRKTLSWLQRYETTITKSVSDRVLIFMQLMSGLDFEYLMEGLHHAGELRQYILRLQELRENGLTCFHSCRLYQKLKRDRENQQKERRMYMSNPAYCWRSIKESVLKNHSIPLNNKLFQASTVSTYRRSAPPLDIIGLPGYDRLTPAERQMCSLVRLVPESYLDFKRILTTECKRHNGLKLAQARTLIKIDVNKTRKVFDFLLQEEFENAETLLISEVHMLLEHRKAQNESAEEEQEFSEVFMKTLTYTNRFRKFKNKETISAVRSLLMQKKLHKFELASLANLCPETPEEAKSLIPSLEGRFEDEELRQILDDIQTKRSLQY
uniref:DNA-directed RNA polymerase II subunit RPB4 n=1 Tax=Timema tahoe TaxID=61484 RepID=A0A7R9IBX2_9NEOP|nr:unnamed protein product [Timema tahoe]